MIRRRLVITGSVLLLLLAALSASLVYYATFTESGLRTIVRHMPRRIGRAQLVIGAPRGTLANGFEIERIELEHERTHLILEGIKGRLAIAPLLWQTLDARDVTLQRAFVEVRRRKQPLANSTPRFLPPGLGIRVAGARVNSATLIATNGRRFDTAHVQASGTVRYRTLRLSDASFDWEAMHVGGNAELRAADPMQIKGDARVTIAWPGQPAWTIDASGRGDLKTLALQARFTAPFRADFTGRAMDLTSRWHWAGSARVHDFDLRAWGGGKALGRITGALALRGDAQGFSGSGPLTPSGLRAGAFETLFEGSYADRMITAKRLELHHASGASMQGTGAIAIVTDGPRLDLRGGWRDFRWPLTGKEVAVRSAVGEYTLSGVWPYNWRATGPLAVRNFAAMPFDAEGRLAKDRVFLDSVAVEAFDGRANLTGEVRWSPDERWALEGRAVGVNPARVRPDLPGKVNFAFRADGIGFDGEGDYAVTVRNLSGQLRKVRASGGGRLARRGKAWELEGIRLALGRTHIAADGHIAREVKLRFAIDAEDLSLLAQGSRGQLHARGNFGGSLEDPVVQASVRGSGIRHAGIALESLTAAVDFHANSPRASKIDARARNLAYAGRAFSTLSFALDGAAGAHVARLNARTGELAVELQAGVAFAHGAWNGQLRALNVDGGEAVHLALDAPVALQASARRARVDSFCLQGRPARVCASADWSPTSWAGMLTAKNLPLSTLTSGLTNNVEYRGALTVTAHAMGGGTAPMQGDLRADLVDARIVHRLASGRLQSILLGSGLVTANATPGGAIEAQVGLAAGQVGTIKGRVALARNSNRWQDMPLQGTLQIETAELGFITLYAPQIDRAAGRLAVNLTLDGTAGTPLVNGSIRLTDAELDQYQVNLALRGAMLDARLSGTGLDFNGSARIGAGEARANGRLEWRDALPYGKLHLEGENLRVTDVPEAQIDASPDLDFNLDGRRIEVTGAVAVPYARIVPSDLRNAVRASADEILVGETAAIQAKKFTVVSQIKLSLGDRVSVDTLGLTGRLTGSIAVRSGYDEITHGTGELSVEEGKYTAYGRKLDIQRGRLIFTGGPLENPGVDIRAIKQFPQVIAGVNVRGTLLHPRTTFFSEPSLPQSQILSLILAGGSLESAQNRQTGAGNELLAQGGAILAQQLGSRVGLEDVSLESNLANETSLVLGKYLSPRLYVSYGISLAEAINTLKLRYSLNDHWTVKSEVGEARGVDLVYTIEK